MSYIPINDRVRIPMMELRINFARSGANATGGLGRLDTKVEVRWSPARSEALSDQDREWLVEKLRSQLSADGDLVVISSKSREQAKNRSEAIKQLAGTIRDALVRPKGAASKVKKPAAAVRRVAARRASTPAKKRARG